MGIPHKAAVYANVERALHKVLEREGYRSFDRCVSVGRCSATLANRRFLDYLVPREACNMSGQKAHLPWLIRKVEVIRGTVPFRLECAPAFNYCRDKHETTLERDDSSHAQSHDDHAVFRSKSLHLDLRYFEGSTDTCTTDPHIKLEIEDLSSRGLLGPAISSNFELEEGQTITFVLREYQTPKYHTDEHEKRANPNAERAAELGVDMSTLIAGAQVLRPDDDPMITEKLLHDLQENTIVYWQRWIGKSKYKGRWREVVHRSALTLKMMIFEETGAIVAAPTFSLPEYIGGSRNWDYRFTWVRDSSFTLYALIRLGFTDEANAFMEFIFDRLKDRESDGSLQMWVTSVRHPISSSYPLPQRVHDSRR